MAGLAAALNVPDAVDPIGTALAARGPDGAACRVDGVRGARLDLLVRGVLPSIVRVVGQAAEAASPPVVAAIAVDGVASMSALDAGYAGGGPAGLLGGREPYAAVLADAEKEALVLARNGAGPGLYYARHGDGWVVASEPRALLAGGVRGRPDADVVARFVVSGEVDDTASTFFDTIAQVLPDEVVVLERDGEPQRHGYGDERRRSVTTALGGALSHGRPAVLLRPGPLGAAVLGAALARPERAQPLPVHTVTFTDLDDAAAQTPAVLAPLPHGAVRHTPHAFDTSTLDLDCFLRDLGEPVADLDLYLLWAVARDLGGDADVVVDSGRGGYGGVARLNDRLMSRYGVSVRCPLREATSQAGDDDIAALINKTLPPATARYASRDPARPPETREIVLRLRDAVAAALAVARPWSEPASSVDALRRLAAGEPVDADVLLRAYLVERWLGTLDGELAEVPTPPAGEVDAEPPDLVEVGDVAPEDSYWLRWPVRTDRIRPGTQLAATLAFHVDAALAELRTQRPYAEALRKPWFAVVAGKAVAVAQQRFTPLWSVHPGLLARALARIGGRRLPLLAEPWSMQVAIDEVGRVRMLGAVVAALLRRHGWLDRLLPDGAPVFAPRPGAVPPADSAVVRTPSEADGFADAIVSALKYCLPAELFETLAGAAVVRADESGSRVLGYGPGPFAAAVPRAEELVARACADNPAGQGRGHTPLVVVLEAPTPRRRERDRDPRLLDIKPDRVRTPSKAG